MFLGLLWPLNGETERPFYNIIWADALRFILCILLSWISRSGEIEFYVIFCLKIGIYTAIYGSACL